MTFASIAQKIVAVSASPRPFLSTISSILFWHSARRTSFHLVEIAGPATRILAGVLTDHQDRGVASCSMLPTVRLSALREAPGCSALS